VSALDMVDVVVPASRDEAVRAFGDGAGVIVFGGGTILMPDIALGRVKPSRAILLGRAGLDGVRRADGRTTIGATTSVAELETAPEPLASAARNVADREVRAQATVGGNLCAPPGAESPRGDLQAALIALGARVRSAGADGERTEAVEDFLAGGPEGRLVLEVEFEDPAAGAHASLGRPHAHAYTTLAVCAARTADGVRVAVSGAAPRGARCRSVEQAFGDEGDPRAAAERILDDATPHDDALASAWYRRRMLPLLAQRALNDLG
jgi:aerobic carbon-monoxide dehydrogenase medium subunit